MACTLGLPIAGSSEVMIFQAARSPIEFWRDNLWLAIATLAILLIGGAIGAARALLHKMAYDEVARR